MAFTLQSSGNVPGKFTAIVKGASGKCDKHPGLQSIIGMIGEADSYGAEVSELCQSCYDNAVIKKAEESVANKERVAYCEIHKGNGKDVKPFRDPDEGQSGRLYDACYSCRKEILDNF